MTKIYLETSVYLNKPRLREVNKEILLTEFGLLQKKKIKNDFHCVHDFFSEPSSV